MDVVMQDSAARCGLAARHVASRTWAQPACGEDRSDPDPALAHDPAVLPAALEAVESRRLALEWLLEADLLRFCME
jgi:hypothetical protein